MARGIGGEGGAVGGRDPNAGGHPGGGSGNAGDTRAQAIADKRSSQLNARKTAATRSGANTTMRASASGDGGLSVQTASGQRGGVNSAGSISSSGISTGGTQGEAAGSAGAIAAAGGLTSPGSPLGGGSGSQGNNPIVSAPSIGGAYGSLPSPDMNADLLELLEQLLDAEKTGGTDASGDLGAIGLSDTHSFPEFLGKPQGKLMMAIVLIGAAIGGAYLWKKAA
jgi:hypothetical protein